MLQLMQTFKTISIKQFMLPFLVALLTINVHSQKPKTYYINSTGEKCSKQNAKLKRTVINIDNLWMVQEHYLNDSLRMSGSFLDKRLTQKTGLFTYYYPNGKTSRTVEFKNDIKHGNENTYFVSGKKSMLSNYTNGEVTGHWIWYNEDGSIENEIENITPNKERAPHSSTTTFLFQIISTDIKLSIM